MPLKDGEEQLQQESFVDKNGSWFCRHVLQETQIDKVKLLKFLRDTQRICWLEIYLKVFAASEPPLLCRECGTYYTITQAGTCFYHPLESAYDVPKGVRRQECCREEFVFGDIVVQ